MWDLTEEDGLSGTLSHRVKNKDINTNKEINKVMYTFSNEVCFSLSVHQEAVSSSCAFSSASSCWESSWSRTTSLRLGSRKWTVQLFSAHARFEIGREFVALVCRGFSETEVTYNIFYNIPGHNFTTSKENMSRQTGTFGHSPLTNLVSVIFLFVKYVTHSYSSPEWRQNIESSLLWFYEVCFLQWSVTGTNITYYLTLILTDMHWTTSPSPLCFSDMAVVTPRLVQQLSFYMQTPKVESSSDIHQRGFFTVQPLTLWGDCHQTCSFSSISLGISKSWLIPTHHLHTSCLSASHSSTDIHPPLRANH